MRYLDVFRLEDWVAMACGSKCVPDVCENRQRSQNAFSSIAAGY